METGLNGWFGRRLKGLISFVAERVDTAVKFYSGGVITTNFKILADDIGTKEGGSSFWNKEGYPNSNCLIQFEQDERAMYEPTEEEFSVLKAFSEKIADVLAKIYLEFDKFSKTNDFVEKVTIANSILEKIAIIKAYFEFNETDNLSFKAIQSRALIIDLLTQQHICAINDFERLNSKLFFTQIGINIKPGTVIKEMLPNQAITVDALGIKYLRLDFVKIVDEIITPIDTIITNPITTDPVKLNPVATEIATKNKSGINWIFLAIAGFVGYKILK